MQLKLKGLLVKRDIQPLIIFFLLMLGVAALLWWRLGTLTHGYSPEELRSLQQSLSLKYIFNHPLNAPFYIIASGFYRVIGDSLLAVRLASAVFGLASIGIFYWLVRFWHGSRSALIGTILFGTSAWFLHTARFGSPDVLLFLLLGLVASAVWIRHSKTGWPLLVGFALATALIYVPGMIWFIALGVLWQWKRIDRLFKRNLIAVTIGALVVVAALAPLVWALYQHPELGKQVLGLPAQGWPDPLASLKALVHVPLAFLWRSPENPAHWLARLPILDAFTLAMTGLGIYLYAKYWRLKRSRFVCLAIVSGSILIALGGHVTLSIIMPFMFILAATGTDFMLEYWQRVFPRNIIAQAVGTVILAFAIFIAVWYNLRHYYVAWPDAPPTRAAFNIRSNS
ncbi:MAG TPA: glycosyltransferase family 39 protein [Candidatus Saccharimonadales bacterium]|nr:glycosyltransferase family 39 protein [Candidatus Saccharimonadales bacterium]